MLFSIVQIHAGLIPAFFVFLIWSLPGALGMYGLSLGVQRIHQLLPDSVYALLSGLNAATVGIIALAAVQLAKKAITDKLTRILVAFGGCAGLCFNALWYFPVLIVIGGFVTVLWDLWGYSVVKQFRKRGKRRSITQTLQPELEDPLPMSSDTSQTQFGLQRRQTASGSTPVLVDEQTKDVEEENHIIHPSQIDISAHSIPIKIGLLVIALFFALLTALLSLRGVLHHAPLRLALFNNMFLAGTIIFGGGPVVIPLLREYVVVPGWVSPRDFLIGLAVIQAFPGPNFNFAVYLGALAITSTGSTTSSSLFVGALLGFLGIFLPGIWLSVGLQSIWRVLRRRREVVSILRGVNATAVGFVFTAIYRLWEAGYLTSQATSGVSLGLEPWWLVIAAATFTAVEWFSTPPAVAILLGGIAGVGWWGAVKR